MHSKITSCGIKCEECVQYKNKVCDGCHKSMGKACWLKYYEEDTCPIYECSVNQNGLNHCGECEKLPCEKWGKYKDIDITKEDIKKIETQNIQMLRSLGEAK